MATGLTDVRRYYMSEGSNFFVVCPESNPGEVAGYAAVCKREGGKAELKNVIVSPDHQGRGLGCLLVPAVEDYVVAQGYHTIELWTYAHLATATGMYERRGYRQGELVESPDMFMDLEPLYYTMSLAQL